MRAPWRILVPLLLALSLPRPVGRLLVGSVPLPALFCLFNLVVVLVTVVVVAASTRALDHGRTLLEYGLAADRRWLGDLAAGVVAGLGGVTVSVLVALALGWFDVAAVFVAGEMAFWPGVGLVVLAYLFVAVAEELLYRGVVLTNAAEGLAGVFSRRGAVAGGLLSSATLFALPHAGQVSHPAYLVTWVLAGLVFGVLYLLSGDLALPVGVHLALNAGFSALFVRSDLGVTGRLSAVVSLDPAVRTPLLAYGGVVEAGAFLTAGVFAGLWLWYARSRGLDPWNHPTISVGRTERGD